VGDRTIANGTTTAVSATEVIRVIAATGVIIATSGTFATISAEGRSAVKPVKPVHFRQKPGPA
jgi:hypothetical protein